MKYLIPIAASSDLFPAEEFHFPKPLIEVDGKPMIMLVIENILRSDAGAEFIFVVRDEDCRSFDLDRILQLSTNGRCAVVKISSPTKGAACSALLAIDSIDKDAPIIICNGDQIIDVNFSKVYQQFHKADAAAGVVCFPSLHPRWSYVRTDTTGVVVEAAEKRVLSRDAVAGYYYFSSGELFIAAVQDSIRKGASVNGAYYIAPALNEVILRGGRVEVFRIGEPQYHSFYSPQRIEYYINHNRSKANSSSRPLQIIIPMAGLGSRFSKVGYDKPKPFIDVLGAPMIARVMENLNVENAKFILIARKEHLDQEAEVVGRLSASGRVKFIAIDHVTEGAVCTALYARGALDPLAPIMIANCDQIIDLDCQKFADDASSRSLDGSILCFHDPSRDPKWSFAKLDDNEMVTEVREKVAISELATVGLYWFRTAELFINAAVDMICRNERVNNEFYVCPTYNYLIQAGGQVGAYLIKKEAMHGIGTPEDLQSYLRLVGGRR